MRYPQQPLQDPYKPVPHCPPPEQAQPMQPGQQPFPQPMQPGQQQFSQPIQPGQQQFSQPMQPGQQQFSQPMQPGQQQFSQPIQPGQQQFSQPMQPGQQQFSQPIQPRQQPLAQPMQPPVAQDTAQTTAVPISKEYRKRAGLYTRDSWWMLAILLAILLVIFIVVRMATRGYLWGLIFVLLAAVAVESPALRLWVISLMDLPSREMMAHPVILQSITEESAGLLTRLGLSSRARYRLTDTQGQSYFFTAEKGLEGFVDDLTGAEAEVAYLQHARLMTGLNPVRRASQLTVMDSARERHLRQVFRDYLP
ncbi:MAG: hypothetical protein ACI4MJ_03120 [Aristaeellaceae bacterium]